MVSISAPSFDLSGQVILPRTTKSRVFGQSRRVTRTKTLDGGVSISDMGYSQGDRTLDIISRRISRADADTVQYLHQNYPLLIVSLSEGIFIGVIQALAIRNGDLAITYLVESKLA